MLRLGDETLAVRVIFPSMLTAALPPTFLNPSPLVNTVGMKRDVLGFFTRLAREAGGFAYYELPSGIYYFVNDPALVREVLVTRRDDFHKWAFNEAVKLIFRDSVLGSEEPRHRQMQRIVRPAFGREHLADHARRMVDLTLRHQALWQEGEIDLARDFSLLTLEIVAQCLFSVSLGGMAADILDSINTVERFSARLGSVPEDDREIARVLAVLDRIADGLLAERRRADPAHDDLFQMLLAAGWQNPGTLTDEDIRDEVLTFLLAGHMTTAASLGCACWLLARHPAVQTELRRQVDAALGGARPPTLADVPALAGCERVFLETLRMYPPVWAYGREAAREVSVGGRLLPVGSRLVICPWVLHRDEGRFPDPEEFRPARWENGLRETLPVGGYLPFSVGPRACLGERFATLEVTLMLACLVQRWEFSLLPDGGEVTWSPQIILWPRRGVRLHAARRAPADPASL